MIVVVPPNAARGRVLLRLGVDGPEAERVVHVRVDASGNHDAARRVDHGGRVGPEGAGPVDRHDLLAADGDVESVGRRRRDDRAAADEEVVRHLNLPRSRRRRAFASICAIASSVDVTAP